jgi:membrane fusion protein, copper/silver efflux system
VSVPQGQMKDIVSWQEGRVDNLVLAETGGTVKQGEHILDIYSEPLVQAQNEYLLALKAAKELGSSGYDYISSSSNSLLDASRQKLLRLGLSADQLTELEAKGTVEEHLPIKSLYGGVVMDKMVTQGMFVMKGEKLFSVADLGTVWVELSVFEKDIANIKIGDQVTLKSPTHTGMVFTGKVQLIEPELNMDTRTFRVRVVVNNPQMLLRPGEILDAELTFNYSNLLLLPRNAVLHTGDGDLVYVMAGENLWEPRRVTVGRDFGDKVEIVSGIKPDEAVAATAVFLLDSEAQLKGIPRPIDLPELPPEPAEESTHGGK